MRILVTGAKGQLGTDVVAAATAAGADVLGLGSADLDITDPAAVEYAVAAFAAGRDGGPDVLVNAAAYTAVDAAETDTERAYAVNEAGPAQLAASAAGHGVRLIHVSTDYVFPGDAQRPYRADDPTGPRSVYGASKLAGERAVTREHPGAHIVRTAWVYGAAGGNFVRTMASLERSRPTVSVVDDQVGSPTWSADLAAGLLELAAADLPGGVLHATNAGQASWFEFAQAVFAELGADPGRVLPTTTAAFPRPAPRPAYSVLSGQEWSSAGLTPLRPWRDALAAAFAAHGDAFRGERSSAP
jgi:dTDP-4-dehydrorhamnose reductase